MATAFFKMSRSLRRRSHSRLKRLSSSSSGFRWSLPGKACVPSSLSCRFHRDKTPVPIPSRLSTSFAVIPSSDAIRTASILNSRSYFLGIDTPPVSLYDFALRGVYYFEKPQTFPSVIATNDGILPRRSINVCILTAPLLFLKRAHGKNDRQRSIVVESRA